MRNYVRCLIALLAERKSGLVSNDNAVGVQLQDRSRAFGRNRTIAHIVHGLSLGLAVGDARIMRAYMMVWVPMV